MANAISAEVLARLLEELSREDVAEMGRLYRQDSAAMLAAMRDAAAAGNERGWQRAAHRLAGGAGGLGATLVEATARMLMEAPLPPDAPAVLARLQREIEASWDGLDAALRDQAA